MLQAARDTCVVLLPRMFTVNVIRKEHLAVSHLWGILQCNQPKLFKIQPHERQKKAVVDERGLTALMAKCGVGFLISPSIGSSITKRTVTHVLGITGEILACLILDDIALLIFNSLGLVTIWWLIKCPCS